MLKKYNLNKVVKVCKGGNTGQDSIFLGLSEVKKKCSNAIVLIHDGVRPLITNELINDCIKNVKKYGSAIPIVPACETPIYSEDGINIKSMPLRRNLAQSPQSFYLNDILNAHLEERKTDNCYDGITDSCGLMLKHNIKCHLFKGIPSNIKVTTLNDYFTLLGKFAFKDYDQFIK